MFCKDEPDWSTEDASYEADHPGARQVPSALAIKVSVALRVRSRAIRQGRFEAVAEPTMGRAPPPWPTAPRGSSHACPRGPWPRPSRPSRRGPQQLDESVHDEPS